MLNSRVGRFVSPLLAATVLAACQASPSVGGPTASSTPGPTASSTPGPTASSRPDLFADLPYTLDLPDGWVGGDPEVAAGQFDDLNPELAKQIRADATQAAAGSFTAWDAESTDRWVPALGAVLQPAPAGYTSAELLDEAERQNRASLEGLVGLIGPVTMERVQLPIGEALVGRWRLEEVVAEGKTADMTVIAYVFLLDETLYTFAFTALTDSITAHEQEFLTIVSSFQPH